MASVEVIPVIIANGADPITVDFPPKRRPRYLKYQCPDEVRVTSGDETVQFRYFIVPRYKDSYYSGSEWRTSTSCTFSLNDIELEEWNAGGDLSYLRSIMPCWFDRFLYDRPQTKREERIRHYHFMKSLLDNGTTFSDSDSDGEFARQPESKVLGYQTGDEEIPTDCKTVFRHKDSENIITKCSQKEENIKIEFLLKGIVYDTTILENRSIATALTYVNESKELYESLVKINLNDYCFQPGCSERYDVEYTVKKKQSEWSFGVEFDGDEYYRRFCKKHKRRGDCGLDDADDNYVLYQAQ